MFTVFLYGFAGICALYAIGFMSLLYQSLSLNVKFKKLGYERESSLSLNDIIKARIIGLSTATVAKTPPKSKPEEDNQKSPEAWEHIQSLMEVSPNHPEINEIEKDDSIVGVMFQGNAYPPELD